MSKIDDEKLNPRTQEWREFWKYGKRFTDEITEVFLSDVAPTLYIQMEYPLQVNGVEQSRFAYAYPPLDMIAELMREAGWTCTPPEEPKP